MTLNAFLNAEHQSENFQYKSLYSFTIAETALNESKYRVHWVENISSLGMNVTEVSFKGKGCKYSSAPGVCTSIEF